MNIGESMKKLRIDKGMTQQQQQHSELVNISRISIGNYERGDRIPPVDIALKISMALGVPIGDIIDTGNVIAVDNGKINIINYEEKAMEALKVIVSYVSSSDDFKIDSFPLLPNERKHLLNLVSSNIEWYLSMLDTIPMHIRLQILTLKKVNKWQ